MPNCPLNRQIPISFLALALGIALLGGCAGTPFVPPTTESSGETELDPIEPAKPEEVIPELIEPPKNAARNNAAGVLLAQSESLRESGQLPQAVALVERAIRLEPSRGDLWVQLGRLRFEEGELARAEQYARKGIALTRSEAPAHQLGWLLLADVSAARGDATGAEQIRRRWLNDRG